MIIEGNTIIADEGKVLRRKDDKLVFGDRLTLGYTYYIGGQKLAEPRLEIPEDYEDLTPEEIQSEKLEKYPALVESYIRERYTVSDELALHRQRNSKKEAFADYYAFCEDCKARAKKELDL